MDNYIIVSNDGKEVIFDKKEIKLFPSIMNRFSNECNRIEFNYSHSIISAIKDFCAFCKKNNKAKGMFDKIEVMCSETGKYKKIYTWAMNWIQANQIAEMNEFIKEYRNEDIESILGLHLAHLIEIYNPEELANLLNENYNDDEDYHDMIEAEIDWLNII